MLLIDESRKLLARIDSGENLTFVRYGDGEVMLAAGMRVGTKTQAFTVDRWQSGDGMTEIGKSMRVMLTHPEWVYGIPCQCCNLRLKELLLSALTHVPAQNITFANMFVNAAFPNFERWLSALSRPVVLFTNQAGEGKVFPFPVMAHVLLPDNCVVHWEHDRQRMIANAVSVAKAFRDTLFLFSGGPLKVLIHYMYEANPSNVYLDVGSAIDPWVYGRFTRPYHDRNGSSPYAHRNCTF